GVRALSLSRDRPRGRGGGRHLLLPPLRQGGRILAVNQTDDTQGRSDMRREIVTMGVAVLAGVLLAGGPAALAQTTDRGQEQPPQNQPMERTEGQTTEPIQARPIELPQVDQPQAELMPRGEAALSRPDDVPPSD